MTSRRRERTRHPLHWLLRLSASEGDRQAILGDLDEEYRLHVRPTRSWPAAEAWYVGQLIAAAWSLAHTRRVQPGGLAATSRSGGGGLMSRWIADSRHAGRALARRPAATIGVVLVLALGIGLSTAMFALADPYLLRPLPYASPSALVAIEVGEEGLTREAALPTIDDWRARADLFTGIAVANAGRAVERLRLADRSLMLISQAVSPNLFEVLGVPGPAEPSWRASSGAGRWMVFLPAARGRVPDAVLEGSALVSTTDGGTVRVAGALAESFVLPFDPPEELLALTPAAAEHIITVRSWNDDGTPQRVATSPLVARLAPNITPAAAREALARVLPSGRRLNVTVTPLHDRLAARLGPQAVGALAAGVLVLLVCAGNVANLRLAASTWRDNEMAVRRALGASRRDLWRLVGMEALLLVGLGTALAFAIAAATLLAIGRVIPAAYSSLGAPTFTSRTLAFGLLAALFVGATGLLPVLFRPVGAPSAGRTPGALGRRHLRSVRVGLVSMQTALATVLTIGAMLLGHSYLNLEGQPIGYDRDVIGVTAVYPTGSDGPPVSAYQESADRLSRLPGVRGAAIFFGNVVFGDLAEVVGRLAPPWIGQLDLPDGRVEVTTRTVTPGFFEVAGLAIVEGRALQPTDVTSRGVVVNQRLASLVGRENLLGRTLRLNGDPVTLVGVAEDAFERRFTDRPTPTIYAAAGAGPTGALTYLIRADGPPATYATSIRRALFDVEPDVVVIEIDTLGAKLSRTVRERSFATLVLVLFGVAGVGVTVAGLLGIVSFTVARRTSEVAIRVALGAAASQVRRVVVSEALVAAGLGIVVGLVTGRWLSTGLGSLVYGVEAGNWRTALAAAFVMLVLSAFAALVPAQRAVRLPPSAALRID